jgi:hypothetical protein
MLGHERGGEHAAEGLVQDNLFHAGREGDGLYAAAGLIHRDHAQTPR